MSEKQNSGVEKEMMVFRTERMKTKMGMGKRFLHNLRQKLNLDEYIDPALSMHNIYGGAKTVEELWQLYIEKLKIITSRRKIQRNASPGVEDVYSFSNSFCKDWLTNKDEKNKVLNYFKDILNEIKKLNGDTILCYAIHFDETTPHMHIFHIPIVGDKKGGYKYSSSEFIGDIKKMKERHTKLYENVGKKYGLGRGIEGSRAKHVTLKQYRQVEENKIKDITKNNDVLENLINENKKLNEQLLKEKQELEKKHKGLWKRERELMEKGNEITNRERYLNEFDNTTKFEIPEIPIPGFQPIGDKRQSWRDDIQSKVTTTFTGLKEAVKKLQFKYDELLGKFNRLMSNYKVLQKRAEDAERHLLETPIEEIVTYRKQQKNGSPEQKKDIGSKGKHHGID